MFDFENINIQWPHKKLFEIDGCFYNIIIDKNKPLPTEIFKYIFGKHEYLFDNCKKFREKAETDIIFCLTNYEKSSCPTCFILKSCERWKNYLLTIDSVFEL